MTRIQARGEQAQPYEGLPRQDVLLWDAGLLLAVLLACALAAGLLTQG